MNKRVVKKIVIFDAKRETLLATETAKTKSNPNRKRKLDDANNITNNNNNAKKRKLSNQEASQSKVTKTAPNPKRVSKTKNNRDDATIGASELKESPSEERTKSEKQTSVGKVDEVEDASRTRNEKKGYGESKATECDNKGVRITWEDLCEECKIKPLNNGLSLDIAILPWAEIKDRIALIFMNQQIIQQLAQVISEFSSKDTSTRNAFAELRKKLANKLVKQPKIASNLNKLLPNLVNWEQKFTKSPRASEQDFPTLLYSTLFDLFFQDIPSVRRSSRPLPALFKSFKRMPDMRAFVDKNGVEFVCFIREDCSACKEGTSEALRRLVQLMRCALELQIAHLKDSKEALSIYCFGILTCGYKIQLLEMHVDLYLKGDYERPVYELWAKDELDLSNFAKESIIKLLRWLTIIRLYYLSLADAGELREKTRKYATAQKPVNPSTPTTSHGLQGTHEEIDQETLNAIVNGIKNDEAVVLQENVKYHKRVLAVCTTVNHIRMFAVKIYGAECTYMNEVELLKVIGYHPNICQTISVTKLDGGDTMVVQPWYQNSDGWHDDFDEQDNLPVVFLQLAKGLSHMHERGVIHGDIKPGNFLVDSDCNTRIIDFDFSTRIEDAHKLGGTDGFHAPEWYSKYLNQTGEGPLTIKFDIWSLAVTMCQYAGINFGDVDDPLERRAKIFDNLELTTLPLWPVRDLLKRMLSIRPSDRPSASEVFDELVHVYGDRGIAANEKTCQVTQNKQHEESRQQRETDESSQITSNYSTNQFDNNENRGQRVEKSKQALVKSPAKRNKDRRRGVLNDVTNIVK